MSASLSEQLAQAAARLVVEEGLGFGAAKRKAARSMERSGGGMRASQMPSDDEVEDEVRTYLNLFHADTQPGELQALRRIALQWMDRLAEFRPYVSGPVWRGTATRLSDVCIDLFCDDPKSAEITLLNQGVRYDVGTALRGGGREPMDVLTLYSPCAELNEAVSVHLIVCDLDDLRGALKPDARGRPLRGDREALGRLLKELVR